MMRVAYILLGMAIMAAFGSCTPKAAVTAPVTAPVAARPVQCPTQPKLEIKIVPAKDGGMTCFTPDDIAALRKYITQCSGAR